MLGIIAVQGTLPKLLIEACLTKHQPFFILAFKNLTDPDLVGQYPHAWVTLGQIKTALTALHKAGVTDLVMAGSLKRPSLRTLKMDATALKWFARIGAAAFGDDGLLRGIIKLLEQEGFRVIAPQDILQDILAPVGIIGKHSPTKEELKDIEKGIIILRTLAPFDIGQGAILEHGVVMALEAIEGTDEMMNRTQSYKREKKAGVLIKICKPQQEKRIDLPTIGPRTIEKAATIGLRGIAVQAGASNIIDLENVKKLANQKGLFIYGFKA